LIISHNQHLGSNVGVLLSIDLAIHLGIVDIGDRCIYD
jgi:hypothetical protein